MNLSHSQQVIDYLQMYGIKKVSLFGSRVRGEEHPESDLDILVEFSFRPTLLQLIKMERELSTQLGIKIDLLTENAISPFLRQKIKSEAITIFG